ncbi:MAG TPA: outer membrane protein assembly factor BamD [Gammaproteobacteria bacterium]
MFRASKTAVVAALAATALAGCGRRDNVVQDAGPEALYERGYEAMQASNYAGAVAYFTQLEARYPFSNVTRQAQLDLIYVYYKSQQPEEAVDAADEFIRENPTHERVDYCLYMKGRVYFDQAPNILERLFKVDLSVRPPKDTMLSFEAFQELLQRFPNSPYAADARQRMVFLRNRLAEYENHVARYYIARGAYVAAANRAKYALEHYPGAPQLEDSLRILITAYQALGKTDLAADAGRVLATTFGPDAAVAAEDR